MLLLTNKARFIQIVKAGKIDQLKLSEASLLAALRKDFDANPRGDDAYDYLTSMAFRSFTNENAARMNKLVLDKEAQVAIVEATTSEQMWIDDINKIVAML